MTQTCLQVRQCRCFGPVVPPSRAAVPQGEFDKSLSACFDKPIHPPPLDQPEILQKEKGLACRAVSIILNVIGQARHQGRNKLIFQYDNQNIYSTAIKNLTCSICLVHKI